MRNCTRCARIRGGVKLERFSRTNGGDRMVSIKRSYHFFVSLCFKLDQEIRSIFKGITKLKLYKRTGAQLEEIKAKRKFLVYLRF